MDLDDKIFYNYFTTIKITCKDMLNKLEHFERYWY